jgi:hypothetical protein
VKKKLSIVLAVVLTATLLLTSGAFADQGHKEVNYIYWWGYPVGADVSNWLEMKYYSESGMNCGPCSGVSIGRYYKTRPLEYYDKNYGNLPDSDSTMCAAFHEYMDTDIFGGTGWHNYGPGFVEMALHYEYDNFSYVYYGPDSSEGPVDADFFEVIEDAIDNGWPVALAAIQVLEGFSGVLALPESDADDNWPPDIWHWIAIKGYSYSESFLSPGYTYNLRILCTDNYSHAGKTEEGGLWLSWVGEGGVIDEVGEDHLVAVVIKDVDTENDSLVENFEWGTDGDSLEDWQDTEDWQDNRGEVDWEVVGTSGDSGVEIDEDVYHGESGRSARFYKDTYGTIAYYSLPQPSYIDFWVKKDDTASAEFRIGDGENAIWVRIYSNEVLQYAYDFWARDICQLQADTWYLIKFSNIDWDDAEYDIRVYLNGVLQGEEIGAAMRPYSGYNGLFYILSQGDNQSTFWIDDITDSLVQP